MSDDERIAYLKKCVLDNIKHVGGIDNACVSDLNTLWLIQQLEEARSAGKRLVAELVDTKAADTNEDDPAGVIDWHAAMLDRKAEVERLRAFCFTWRERNAELEYALEQCAPNHPILEGGQP